MKRRALSTLLVLLLAATAAWAQVPTSNVLYRVLRIRTATATGSAFTIEVDGKQYLITARHLLSGFGSEGEIEIELWGGGRWSKARARAYNDLYTRSNSGIVIGYDIRHVVDAIRAANRPPSPPIP